MVWSQFSIKIFGVHFGNSVLDNSNWDKISHSLTKRSHTCEEGGAHLSEFPFGIYWWILKNRKNQTFQKMKKCAGYIIILRMCTKNHYHMRYSSWDTKWDRVFCHFGPFLAFSTLSPTNNPQNQNFKKWKKHLVMSF